MNNIHKTADIGNSVIGIGTNVWQFVVIADGVRVGENCNICSHVFIESGATIGNNVTIKNGVQLWDGIEIEDNVFIGPNVTFSNDKYPRSKKYPPEFIKTVVEFGASIGANATILPGVRIGRNSMIGAGSVVTKDIPEGVIVIGNPAKVIKTV